LGAAGSYIPTPAWIKHKRAVINVQNKSDNRCFVWSVLAGLFPAREHTYRRQHYAKYEKHLNLDGLESPLTVKDIAKFEATPLPFTVLQPIQKTRVFPYCI